MMMEMTVTVTPLFLGHERFTLDFSFSVQLDVWDLSYLTREKTLIFCSGRTES